MLAHFEFVVQNENTRAYHAGPALVALGSVVAANDDVHSAVRPHLETLASTFGETVHVCTLRGADVVFLGGVESTKALRAGNRTGTVLAAHTTSGGKAMLAVLGDAAVRERYPREALPALTRRTIRTRTALLRDLQHVRERGFAINDAESEPGLYALSCAVLSRTGELRGAITISGPAGAVSHDRSGADGCGVTQRLQSCGCRDSLTSIHHWRVSPGGAAMTTGAVSVRAKREA